MHIGGVSLRLINHFTCTGVHMQPNHKSILDARAPVHTIVSV